MGVSEWRSEDPTLARQGGAAPRDSGEGHSVGRKHGTRGLWLEWTEGAQRVAGAPVAGVGGLGEPFPLGIDPES